MKTQLIGGLWALVLLAAGVSYARANEVGTRESVLAEITRPSFVLEYVLRDPDRYRVDAVTIILVKRDQPLWPAINMEFMKDGIYEEDDLRLEVTFSPTRSSVMLSVKQPTSVNRDSFEPYTLENAWAVVWDHEEEANRVEFYRPLELFFPGGGDCPPDCAGDWPLQR